MLTLFFCRGISLFSAMFLPLFGLCQNITVPNAASPASEVTQKIGISTITVKYSRPSVKSREIWGKLVPYGWNRQAFGNGNEAPWRAGANENTTIQFSHAAKVEGRDVPAGKYGLFFIINNDNTGELILSKDNRSWGSFFYNAAQDQLRAPVKIRDIQHTELLTYDFISIDKKSAELVLNWEKKQFPVKIEMDVDANVLANAMEELKGPIGFNWQGFSSAANYSLQNKINLEQALAWINTAIAQNSSFTTLSIKSKILKQMSQADEAEKIMNDAMAVSTENELNGYGYQLINEGRQDKAIEILLLNTKRFPKSANVWDSLGEAYFTKGDTKNAVANFKKALSMNPPPPVKINSEKFLKQMNAL